MNEICNYALASYGISHNCCTISLCIRYSSIMFSRYLIIYVITAASESLFYEAATTTCSYITTTISPGYQLRMTSSHLLIVLVGIHYIRNYVKGMYIACL